ncbi:hypothetical protein [Nocardiopsis sp. YSL2]|uniref:hypothetical protein n=1 Tax=Nocardiopsis sp. YSL2 TaxID=2939492 RepID=UPI0026F40B3B|nr:hypothetical protein [Nocardiopsis sp. YSL2]
MNGLTAERTRAVSSPATGLAREGRTGRPGARAGPGSARVEPTAELTVLQADSAAENTATDRPVSPETSTIDGVDSTFTHTFPAHSVTFLRITPEE